MTILIRKSDELSFGVSYEVLRQICRQQSATSLRNTFLSLVLLFLTFIFRLKHSRRRQINKIRSSEGLYCSANYDKCW